MAGVTLVRGIDVRTRLIGLAGGDHAVMTTLTGAHGFIVIDNGRRNPGGTGMAGLANFTGENMRCTLTGSDSAIVASDAGIRCGAVIKRSHKPIGGGVADLTGLHSRHVCRALTAGDNAVVTTLASTDDLRMIN